MPVITRGQLRSVSHPNEGRPSEDKSPRTMQESDDIDDPMNGTFAGLPSSEEGEGHESVWDEPESAPEGESDNEESDHPEVDDDYEGTLDTIKGYTPFKLRPQ